MSRYIESLLILSFFVISAKSLFPEWLNHSFLQIPALAVFSIMAAIGFATNLWAYFAIQIKSTWQWFKPASYLILFGIVFIGAQVSFYGSHTAHDNLDSIDPYLKPELFEFLSTAETEEQRKFAAKTIYSEIGVGLPYGTDNGAVSIYSPDEEALELYKGNAEIREQADALRTYLKKVAYQSMYTSLYLVLSFLAVFCVSMIFLQTRANKMQERVKD